MLRPMVENAALMLTTNEEPIGQRERRVIRGLLWSHKERGEANAIVSGNTVSCHEGHWGSVRVQLVRGIWLW